MAYSYKVSISFGLVYIPVTLHNAVKENSIGFKLIDKNTLSRVRYKKTCEACDGREVKQDDIVKGYEYDGGRYVIFDDKDFENLKTKKDKNITIEKFVNISEIDPLYFNKPYYVVPVGAEKAFSVLASAMEQEGKAAIAKTILGTKETLIAIRSTGGQMLLNTLYFDEEITKNPSKSIQNVSGSAELDIAKTIIKGMSGRFEPEKYKDEYIIRVKEAIERKIAGEEIVTPEDNTSGKVIDLMDALKKSLELAQKPAQKAEKPAPKKRTAKSKKVQ